MTLDTFMNHCTACGGNWTAMLMTGIKEVAPEVYDQMTDRNSSSMRSASLSTTCAAIVPTSGTTSA